MAVSDPETDLATRTAPPAALRVLTMLDPFPAVLLILAVAVVAGLVVAGVPATPGWVG